jgi:hypothetical protein
MGVSTYLMAPMLPPNFQKNLCLHINIVRAKKKKKKKNGGEKNNKYN